MNFWHLTTADPDALALVDTDGTRLTRRDLADRTHQSAHALRAAGLREGDTVAVMLSNRREMVEAYLAATEIGLYFLPINRRSLAADIAHLLRDSGSRVLVTEGAHVDVCREAASSAGLPAAAVVSVDPVAGVSSWAEWLAAQPSSLPEERRVGRHLGYTSGTTGLPKGVRYPLPVALPEDMSYPQPFGFDPTPGPHLVACPLYHTGPLTAAMTNLHNGASLVLMGRWTAESHLEMVERHRVVTTTMVPTQFVRLLKLPDEVRLAADQSSLEMVAHMGAPCPVEIKRRMIEWLGPVLYESYGATEGWGLLVDSHEWLSKPGTLGRRCIGDSEVFVLTEDGRRADPGEVGHLYLRTATGWEYLNDPAKTAAAYSGDAFTVGDLGYQDEDGFFFLVTRRVDLILSGGVNIYPAQVEGTLILHPAVRDVAVFGIPNEEWGQEVKAVVELEPGVEQASALAELEAHARRELPSYMVPRSFDVIERMPRDANGKLYKRELSDPYWAVAGHAV